MDQPAGLQVDYVFRGVEHAVRVAVSGQVLELEVEDRMTADQWRGEFDASFIEDLTHKTGNFKQFDIFCNMLESALTQSSESVTLDLLTYTDLESLRNRKMGGRPGPLAPRSAQLNSKRYLILIYSVEFDRIHYPLPLPYQGKPDPVVLQGTIRSLKEELGRLRGLGGQEVRDTREAEIWHLREQVSRLSSEKRELEVQLGRSREEVLAGRAALQEAEALRGLVRGLELELRQERGLGRPAARRGQDCRRLVKELEEVRASERSLRARLRTLNSELALYKTGVGGAWEVLWHPREDLEPVGGPTRRSGACRWLRGRVGGDLKVGEAWDLAAGLGVQGRVVDSFRSRCSSASSCSELDDFSESLSRGVRRRRKPPSPARWNRPSAKSTSLEHGRHQRRLGNSGGWVPIKDYSSDHQTADMAEIDARLKALQEYMNRLDTRS
ncbi:centrosomal protein CCDC61 [Orycteropus afer afer]|uniref:Centrosomal protein CCDC61 n=1 Tax=Orycteropus afer afer TaxID=1230840 RepID=A0AC54Z6Y3_ORYAF|nr:centrosomal protein CCDC61 [Orycteropus afer afer]